MVIDHADHVVEYLMDELVDITNFNHDSVYMFTLVLCGSSKLNSTLSSAEGECMDQRKAVQYDFKGLNSSELPRYIKHKLEIAGGRDTIIDPDIYELLQKSTGGSPRKIDNLMTDALAYGAQSRKQIIDKDTMILAIRNHDSTK